MLEKKIESIYNLYKESSSVIIDSRKATKGSLFFALKGDNTDGNMYAADAIEKGAIAAIIDDCKYSSAKTICVDNVLEVLQKLAAYHLKTLGTDVFALTGTNGKTTTKELIRQVLSAKFDVFATEGNFNNHIGLPLMVLNMRRRYDIAVLEMGASKPGDIKELCEIANPTYGLITNIGKAHLEYFGSQENLIKTKMEIYDAVNSNGGVIFYNCANKSVISLSEYQKAKKITYGLSDKSCDYTAESFVYNNFFAGIRTENVEIKSQLVGKYNAENILAAYAVGRFFGVSETEIKHKIENYIPQNKRSQFVRSKSNSIVLDAYNANPTSMKNALESFFDYKTELTKVLILGDMLELGKESDREHKKILEMVMGHDVMLLAVGSNFYKFKGKYKNFMFFESTDELEKYLANNKIENSFVLLKGSRGIALEKILHHL